MDQSSGGPLNSSHQLPGYGVHESALRVESVDSNICGSAVAITPRHVASCAHVVLDALHLPPEQTQKPSGKIKLTVWRDGRDHGLITNRFFEWSPVADFDLVIMELPENAPDLLPACLQLLRSDQ